MNFFADLHIHSRFSRATSKDLSLPNLDAWARLKGLKVLATGDFTHPVWRKELKDSLKLDEKSGFYQLLGKPEQLKILPENSKLLHGEGPLYCLEAEISSIYKKNGRVRKIHNLIFVPTLEDADRLAARLEKIGNLSADGRPILGLDAHDLLEILLETVPRGVLIPAHIWTPWFSLFGSKSGFDSLAECFGDLKNEIFALETGLSSNPFMNRCLSSLDQYVLIANSDAHSGAKLAREVNVFGGEPSYDGLFNALRASAKRESGQKQLPCYFESTIEFFPEEGKYHLDGHRQCQVSLVPTASQKCADLCPVCHKPLTIGVLHRVMELADRPNPARLPLEPPFLSVMPLLELTCEIMGLATITERVQKQYVQILEHFGPELQVLTKSPLSELEKYWPALALACERLRSGKVTLEGGYDGVFGKVHLFKEGELENPKQKNFKSQSQKEQTEQNLLEPSIAAKQLAKLKDFKAQVKQEPKAEPKKTSYSEEQLLAINHNLGPALVLAGPGSGKTHLLLGRVQKLLHDGLAPHEILIITFTRQAAKELKTRLEKNLGPNSSAITCQTLHAFCFERCLKDLPQSSILPEETALSIFMEANLELTSKKGRDLWAKITKLREECSLDDPSQASLYKLYDKYQN
ncbi:MAG: UvrD-helicase domain-containing protein, partial [Desulfovibrio sp.]|nr:UvrD-helicase domain-containing protein [Desulfovibrio sp.]